MDKRKDATIEATFSGNHTIYHYKTNTTMLDIINELCKSAERQKKYLVKAEVTTQARHSTVDKSL